MKNKYMVSWRDDLYNEIVNNDSFYYENEEYSQYCFYVMGDSKAEVVEKYLEYFYIINLECMPRKEFKEEVFNDFMREVLEEVAIEHFAMYSNGQQLYEFALEIHDKAIEILFKAGKVQVHIERNDITYSFKWEDAFKSEILKAFNADMLFNILSVEDEKTMWIEQNKANLSVVKMKDLCSQ